MMMLLGQWAALCVGVSSILWLLSRALKVSSPSLMSWPSFWSAMLSLSLIIPVLTVLLSLFPPINPAQHLPLPDLSIIQATVGAALPATEPTPGMFNITQLYNASGLVYLIGVVMSLVRLTTGRWRVASMIRQARPMQINSVEVMISSRAPTAFACETLWPAGRWIVLPQYYLDEMSRSTLATVVQHEQAHLRRGDDRWGMCWRIVRSLCWLSPAVQSFFRGWVLSTEMHCDQEVVAHQPQHERRAYAQSLVQAHRIAANRVVTYPAASFSPHLARSESMRIKHILSGARLQINTRSAHHRLWVIASVAALSGSMALSVHADPPVGAQSSSIASPFPEWVPGRVTSEYGMQTSGGKDEPHREFHQGIDIAAAEGSLIRMPDDGTILVATDLFKNQPAYGKVVVLETGNQTRTLLAHLSEYSVIPGQQVRKGTPIARVGSTGKSTGPHAHIETWVDNERVNPREVW